MGQIDGVVDADGGEDVLEFVDEPVWGTCQCLTMAVPKGSMRAWKRKAYLMSPGSEMPPGVASDPEGDSAVISAVGMCGGCRGLQVVVREVCAALLLLLLRAE